MKKLGIALHNLFPDRKCIMKAYTVVVMVCIVLVGLCSCSRSENITYIEATDGKEKRLIYQEDEYYPENIFTANDEYGKHNEGDVEIGTYYCFPFGTTYYSYTAERPDYIYSVGSGKDVYLREGFDYNSEIFLVDSTLEGFVFSEALTEANIEMRYIDIHDNSNDVVLYSQKYPNLKINAQLFFDDTDWYLVCQTNKVYLISPSLWQILQQNNAIQDV